MPDTALIWVKQNRLQKPPPKTKQNKNLLSKGLSFKG